MKLAACILAVFAPVALTQTRPQEPTSDQTTMREYDAMLRATRKSGDEAFERERLRHGSRLCVSSWTDDAKAAACFSAEARRTEQNYLIYTHMISAVLHLSVPGQPAMPASQQIPFDSAEELWANSMKAVCAARTSNGKDDRAIAIQRNCSMGLTWDHMKELSSLYFLVLEF